MNAKDLTCERCGQAITRLIRSGVSKSTGKKREYGRYCSRACAFAVVHERSLERARKSLLCPDCGDNRPFGRRYCPPCRLRRKQKPCSECQALFIGSGVTCSKACRYARVRAAIYRPQQIAVRICSECHKPFEAKHKTRLICYRCLNRGRNKPESRARRAGVVVVRGIRPYLVFERDGWRCQLCGRKTPKHLRGLQRPTSPEVDHIVPLSRGGGHTWENVQCACHECNHKKLDKPLGQLRLAV